MKILIISEKDAANVSLAKIADKLLERKHIVEVYAVFMAENVLACFDKTIPVYDFKELEIGKCNSYDCILTTSVAAVFFQNIELLSVRIPIFTQNYLINKQVFWRGDICYVPSLPTSVTDFDDYMLGKRIAIGEPKYDDVNINVTDSKKILFIDSGHYPFGREGKIALADTIINICNKFPDYELVVKPRFLPCDKVVTHTNKLHLYDTIKERANGKLPGNLNLLMQHFDLMELIEEACTVVCMYTTAFVGACLKRKGLAILDNLPSDDIYDTRLKTSYRIRDYMVGSGALIDYKKVTDILPRGVAAGDDYIKYLLACRGNSAEYICESMEWLVEQFYSKGVFPDFPDCSYLDLKHGVQIKKNWNWEKQIDARYRDYLMYRMAIHIDFHVKNHIIIDKYWQGFLSESLIDFNEYKRLLGEAYKIRNLCIVDNQDILMSDMVDQGILLNALYLTKNYDKVKEFSNRGIGAYYYFNALICYEEKRYNECVCNLKRYDELSFGRDYILEISDMPNNRFGAYSLLVRLMQRSNADKEELSIYINRMEEVYKELYKVDSINDKCRNRNQYNHLASLKWLKALNSNLLSNIFTDSPILVYGAGYLFKNLILPCDEVKQNIVAIIDEYIGKNEMDGIPIIRLSALREMEENYNIIVTVPGQFEEISSNIMSVKPDAKVYSLLELV